LQLPERIKGVAREWKSSNTEKLPGLRLEKIIRVLSKAERYKWGRKGREKRMSLCTCHESRRERGKWGAEGFLQKKNTERREERRHRRRTRKGRKKRESWGLFVRASR